MDDVVSSHGQGPGPMRPVDPHAYRGDDTPRTSVRRRVLWWTLSVAVGVLAAVFIPDAIFLQVWVAAAVAVVVAVVVSVLVQRARERRPRA